MIFIDRTKEPKPQVLTIGADNEHSAAADHYLSDVFFLDPKRPIFPSFNLYSDPQVKQALEDLFNEKCAYCEIQVTRGHDKEKEHFRPKGRVDTNTGKLVPGYYWLSAEWVNLFLSCAHCNQARKQRDQNGIQSTIGKEDQFPLTDSSKIARTPIDQSDEPYRLLINPCNDNPEDFFEFDEKGSILPKSGITGKELKMAETSARVFALIRIKLVKSRELHYQRIEKIIVRIERRLRDYLQIGTEDRKQELEEVLEELAVLQDEQNPASEFVAITRQLVRESKMKIDAALKTL